MCRGEGEEGERAVGRGSKGEREGGEEGEGGGRGMATLLVGFLPQLIIDVVTATNRRYQGSILCPACSVICHVSPQLYNTSMPCAWFIHVFYSPCLSPSLPLPPTFPPSPCHPLPPSHLNSLPLPPSLTLFPSPPLSTSFAPSHPPSLPLPIPLTLPLPLPLPLFLTPRTSGSTRSLSYSWYVIDY